MSRKRPKVHWTQTPEGRKKLSRQGKKSWRSSKRKLRGKGTPVHEPSPQQPDTKVAYAFGHIEAWLQTYAERSDVPFKPFAKRVGQLLQY